MTLARRGWYRQLDVPSAELVPIVGASVVRTGATNSRAREPTSQCWRGAIGHTEWAGGGWVPPSHPRPRPRHLFCPRPLSAPTSSTPMTPPALPQVTYPQCTNRTALTPPRVLPITPSMLNVGLLLLSTVGPSRPRGFKSTGEPRAARRWRGAVCVGWAKLGRAFPFNFLYLCAGRRQHDKVKTRWPWIRCGGAGTAMQPQPRPSPNRVPRLTFRSLLIV